MTPTTSATGCSALETVCTCSCEVSRCRFAALVRGLCTFHLHCRLCRCCRHRYRAYHHRNCKQQTRRCFPDIRFLNHKKKPSPFCRSRAQGNRIPGIRFCPPAKSDQTTSFSQLSSLLPCLSRKICSVVFPSRRICSGHCVLS